MERKHPLLAKPKHRNPRAVFHQESPTQSLILCLDEKDRLLVEKDKQLEAARVAIQDRDQTIHKLADQLAQKQHAFSWWATVAMAAFPLTALSGGVVTYAAMELAHYTNAQAAADAAQAQSARAVSQPPPSTNLPSLAASPLANSAPAIKATAAAATPTASASASISTPSARPVTTRLRQPAKPSTSSTRDLKK